MNASVFTLDAEYSDPQVLIRYRLFVMIMLINDDMHQVILTGAPMSSRIVCKAWKTIYDIVNKHTFSDKFPVHLPVSNSYTRLKFHQKAERLGFCHDSSGQDNARHVIIWHPSGAVHISLGIRVGKVNMHIGKAPIIGGQHWKSAYHCRTKKKKKSTYRILEEEAEEGAPECIKCGFRTWNDFCPDCGRPTL